MKKQDICETTMDRFLELDKNERIPLRVTMHLIFCKKCRTSVRLCTMAEKASAEPLEVALPLTDSNLAAILKRIDPSFTTLEDYPVQPISMKRWLISGFLLIAGVFLFGIFSASATQSSLQVPIYLCFAIFICGYCAFFVGSNLDFFIKQIDKTFHSAI